MKLLNLTLLLFSGSLLFGQSPAPAFRDVIYRRAGGSIMGRVISADPVSFKLEVILTEGQPTAQITFPRSEVDRIVFATDERLENFLKNATDASFGELVRIWRERESLLSVSNSNTGSIGLVLGELLLKSPSRTQREIAIGFFQRVEQEDWNPERKAAAKQGRLRAMLALGQAAEAVKEAQELANTSEDPEVLIEAKFILAEANFQSFRKLLEDNPRWEEDIHVRPERNRLYHETLELYLFPYLFHGSCQSQSARGLWRVVELYQLTGEKTAAAEVAKDLTLLYPGTPEAALAAPFLKSEPNHANAN